MRRHIICLLVIPLLTNDASSQDSGTNQPAKEKNYVEAKVWYAWREGGSGADGTEPTQVGPDRHTKEEAEMDEQQWVKAHPTANLVTGVKEATKRYLITRPSVAKPQELNPPQKTEKPGGVDINKQIRVRAFKLVDGKFVRMETLDFDSDDYEKASEYYWKVKNKEGYSATWLDPQGRKPKIVGPNKPWVDLGSTYKPPSLEKAEGNKDNATNPEKAKGLKPKSNQSLEGTRWTRKVDGGTTGIQTLFIEFQKGNTFKGSIYQEKGTWKQEGDTVTIDASVPNIGRYTATGKIVNQQLIITQTWDDGSAGRPETWNRVED